MFILPRRIFFIEANNIYLGNSVKKYERKKIIDVKLTSTNSKFYEFLKKHYFT